MKKTGIIKLDDSSKLVDLIKNPAKIAEALTGILASDKSDLILSAGKIIQATLKFKLLKQLGRELDGYVEEGKIKEDYFASSNNQASLSELLKFIDEEVPDEDRFNAMKAIFMKSVRVDAGAKEELLAYEYMLICKQLSSSEISILKANLEIVTGKWVATIPPDSLGNANRDLWFANVARQIGHEIPSLVERHEEHLMSLKLISGTAYSDRSAILKTPYYRLTELGKRFCEYVRE